MLDMFNTREDVIEGSVNGEEFASDGEIILKAIRSVITYTIVDVFSLTEEERFWVSHHLENALQPLINSKPHNLALPVLEELKYAKYTILLNGYTYAQARKIQENVLVADVFEWAQALSSVFSESYKLRPIESSAITGKITGMLEELGIGRRESRYLPNTVRSILNKTS